MSPASTPNIIIEFALAVKNEQWEVLDVILHELGKYEILNVQLQFIIVNKYQFIEWLKTQKQGIDIPSIQYDICAKDALQTPVVLFNKGLFPSIIFEPMQMFKQGFMLETDLMQITKIAFCDNFSNTQNFLVSEMMEMAIKDLEKHGFSTEEAAQIILGKPLD